jgi:glycosyltransferase involved in cell wall biosynthesis
VIGIGFGDHRKGLDLFADCAKHVCMADAHVTFIWVGIPEPLLLEKVNHELMGSNAAKKFITTGWQSDSNYYYAASDLYILTSREDPFPTVVMEAMDAYLPVIAFKDGGGYVELISDETGTLVPMEDTLAMSKEILRYLSDADLRNRIGELAHSYVQNKFNFISYTHCLLSLLGENYARISVIVPNYNYAKCLEDRLNSILNQTYPIFELILLDDGSTDESVQIIRNYEKRYPLLIKTLLNEKNQGNVFEQWEKGLAMASGEYVWIAEADDLSDSTFLAKIIRRFIQDEQIVMCYSQSKMMDEYGKVTADNYYSYTDDVDPEIWKADYVDDAAVEIEKRLSVKNTMPNVSAVVFKNKNFTPMLQDAKKYKVAGDWRFYVDVLSEGGKIAYVKDSLNYHRRHSTSVTHELNNQRHYDEICEMQEYIYKKTNNDFYYQKALEYREAVKKTLGL